MDKQRNPWRFLNSGPCDPLFNLALDELLFHNDQALAPDPHPRKTLRLYQWAKPCLSLGVLQTAADFDFDAYRQKGFLTTRRITGGGAILHREELTYSITCDENDPCVQQDMEISYRFFHDAIVHAFRTLDVPLKYRNKAGDPKDKTALCFHRVAPFDLTLAGKKCVGSAQRRSKNRFLQQGSILLHSHDKNNGSVGILDVHPAIALSEIERALRESFAKTLCADLQGSSTSPEEVQHAQQLAQKKYGSQDWLFKK